MPGQTELVRRETFAPILYVMTYSDLEEAIGIHNGVPQGLSSSIFTGRPEGRPSSSSPRRAPTAES